MSELTLNGRHAYRVSAVVSASTAAREGPSAGDINMGGLRRELELQKQKHQRDLKTSRGSAAPRLAQSLTQQPARQMELVNRPAARGHVLGILSWKR